MKRWRATLLIIVCALGALMLSCRSLPSLAGRTVSHAIADAEATGLARGVAPLVSAHPGLSGIVPLMEGVDAFAARALLAASAERSIDAQYYIWHHDLSGTLLARELYRAAERGVRVRLLLDDNNTVGLDPLLMQLNAHPNIEVRLFNPFMHREWRVLSYLTDFSRLNRRMHNKSFTADSQVTIVGGRNVGDEYFGVGPDFLFIDLDVLAIGPVVRDVASDFDRYWASASAYPIDRVVPRATAQGGQSLITEGTEIERDAAARRYIDALTRSPFLEDVRTDRVNFEWAPARMLSDDPAKALGRSSSDELLFSHMRALLGEPQRELELISPYFVPTATGVAELGDLARRGIAVSVLTNSVGATDVVAVHAGYAKRRKALLEHGVRLFELKRGPSMPDKDHDPGGSSASSLHAKTFAVDRTRVFIGSFNFDPRSAELNTENGFVIESATLAQSLAATFESRIPLEAYEVRLNDGAMQWVEQTSAGRVVHHAEPNLGFWRGIGLRLLSWLPIEHLL